MALGGLGGQDSIASALANTGNGAPGGDSSTFPNGGSGVVIVRYNGVQRASGGIITTVGGDTLHTFATTGASSFIVGDGLINLTASAGSIIFSGAVGGLNALNTVSLNATNSITLSSINAQTITAVASDAISSTGTLSAGRVNLLALGGDLTIGGAVSAASGANALNFLSTRDINFNASVQHGGSGAVNVVAGWDGTTGWNSGTSTLTIASITGLSSSYGNDNDGAGAATGTVFINNSAGTSGVAVGSLTGVTTVLGYDLNLIASSSTATRYAMLGYYGAAATGAITAIAKNDINLTAGAASASFAQIGHGGASQNFAQSGAITVTATGNITLTADAASNRYA